MTSSRLGRQKKGCSGSSTRHLWRERASARDMKQPSHSPSYCWGDLEHPDVHTLTEARNLRSFAPLQRSPTPHLYVTRQRIGNIFCTSSSAYEFSRGRSSRDL